MTLKQQSHIIELVERGFKDRSIADLMGIHDTNVTYWRKKLYGEVEVIFCQNENCRKTFIPVTRKKYCSQLCMEEAKETKRKEKIKNKPSEIDRIRKEIKQHFEKAHK